MARFHDPSQEFICSGVQAVMGWACSAFGDSQFWFTETVQVQKCLIVDRRCSWLRFLFVLARSMSCHVNRAIDENHREGYTRYNSILDTKARYRYLQLQGGDLAILP